MASDLPTLVITNIKFTEKPTIGSSDLVVEADTDQGLRRLQLSRHAAAQLRAHIPKEWKGRDSE